MEPVFYIMAILGCGEADTACQQVSVVDQHYASSEACNEATPDMLATHSDVAFPVVVAQCRPAGKTLSEKVLPEQIKLPEPQQAPKLRRASQHTGSLRS